MQQFGATGCRNQLNAELSGWGFPIGSRQRLLQTVARKVASFIVKFLLGYFMIVVSMSDLPVLRI